MPAPDDIKGVPPELAGIWDGGWWEVLRLGCYLRNRNADTHLPAGAGSPIVLRIPRHSPGSPGLAASRPRRGPALGGALRLFTSVGVPAVLFSQETRVCLKVRLMLI